MFAAEVGKEVRPAQALVLTPALGFVLVRFALSVSARAARRRLLVRWRQTFLVSELSGTSSV